MKVFRPSMLYRANLMMQTQMRHFGPKGKAPAAGGPPAAPYVPPRRIKTNFEVMVERDGLDQFMFGPPHGIEKMQNAHRHYVLPKLATRIDMFAKKMREHYIREGIYPDVKIFLDPLRDRQLDDTLQALHAKGEVAAVIKARDEFEDVDLVLPHRAPFTIWKADHGMVRPFYVRHNDEEIMVTVTKIETHFKSKEPLLVEFQRYIPGRPNLLTLPLVPVQEDKSLHFQAGCQFHVLKKEVKVWCYNESYPAQIEVNCQDLSPQLSIKIGDMEMTLPHGMFLHKSFQRDRYHSIVKLTETNSYIQRKNQVIEQADLIRDEKRRIQNRLLSAQ